MLDIKCFSSYYSDGKASCISFYSAMMPVMLALLLLSFQPATAAPEDDGTGNFDYWNSGLDWPGKCAEGKGQSPINIVTKRAVQGTPSKLWLDYEETSNVTLYHTGHVVEVKVNNNNNVMHTPNGPFYLKQLHFHAVSEHTFNGMFGPLEVHYVHLNAEGTKASVFGVIFKLDKDDKDNRYLDDFFHRIPNNTDARINFYWNLKDLIIPRKEKRSYLSYYTYNGSLTTPPCSEIVTWYVRKRTASVSIKQLLYVLKANQDISGDRFDDRLPQPLAGRTVTYVPVI